MRRALRVAAAVEPRLLVGSVLLTLAAGVAPATSAWMLRLLIDGVQQGSDANTLIPLAIGVAVAGAMSVLLLAGVDVLVRRLTGLMRVHEHDNLFRSINRTEDMSLFDEPAFHERLSLARERGIDASGEIISEGLLFVRGALLSISFFGLLLAIHPLLLVGALVVALPMAAIEASLGRTRLASTKEVNAHSRERFLYTQAMAGHREAKEVRLLAVGAYLRACARIQFSKAVDAEHRLVRREFTMRLVATLFGVAFSVATLLWAALRAGDGSVSAGDLTVVAAAGAGIVDGLAAAVSQFGHLHHNLGVQAVFEGLLTVDDETVARPRMVPHLEAAIEFTDVWFQYQGRDDWSLRQVNLRIGADELVAIVGPNGSGKSTLAKLTCRLYDPARGRVTWDGVDLRDYPHADLRRRMGVLFQDFVVYEFSASQNIGLGEVDHIESASRIENAAALAGADALIRELPRGYATRLTRMFPDPDEEQADKGVMLSGGQSQRLTIARLLMRSQADFLLLDEPTSGLDPAAEAELLDTLRRTRSGKATVFITHRLGVARHADRIVVVVGGTVAEQGTHRELIALDGEYARLYQLQAAGYGNDEADGSGEGAMAHRGGEPRGRDGRERSPADPTTTAS